jgi:translation initiation factor IF-3
LREKLVWRINSEIRAPQLRVIAQDGKQIGVVSLEEALRLRNEAGLDLIEIAPTAKPPVAKIADFGKFRYSEEKKLREQKRKTKTTEVKEIRFSPFIAQEDYNTRLTRIKEFLSDSNKVRVVVVFKNRQMGSRNFGYDILKRVLMDLGDSVSVDMEPKFLGRHLAMVISPLKKRKQNNENETEDQKVINQEV